MKCALSFIVLLLLGCDSRSSSPPLPSDPAQALVQQKTRDFFVQWLQEHGHKDVVSDAKGIGVAGNATRLKAAIFKRTNHDNGQVVLEIEFRIALPDGNVIIEYLAGLGESDERAINDALVNFTHTTYHVIYAGFINTDDPHANAQKVTINGKERQVIFGDVYMRTSEDVDPVDLTLISVMLKDTISEQPFTEGTHWAKIVFAQIDGQPNSIGATVDNADANALTAAVTALKWPKAKGFYMVKQFILIK